MSAHKPGTQRPGTANPAGGRPAADRRADVSRETLRGVRGENRPADRPDTLSRAHLERLAGIARAVGTPLPFQFQPACESFLAELTKWSRRINLISAGDRTRVVERHVLDSLCLLAYEGRLAGKQLLDVGPGAGFPGLVLAMWDSGARFTLVESRSKPVAFLKSVRRSLGLANVEVVHARFESAAISGQIPPADIVTSRAVGGTVRLAALAAPLLKPGGAVVVYAARRPSTRALTADDRRALGRLGLTVGFVTPPWQTLTTLLILRKLS